MISILARHMNPVCIAKKLLTVVLIASLMVLLPLLSVKCEGQNSSADVGESRRGFNSSLAIGFGVVSFHQVHYLCGDRTWKAPTHTKLALHTNGRVGYAPTDYFYPYLCTNSYWFSEDFTATEGKEIARSGLFGIGMTFYAASASPTAYLSVEIGRSFFGAPFEKKIGSQLGQGVFACLGYQFSRRHSIELCAMRVTTAGPGLITNVWSYSLSLNLN